MSKAKASGISLTNNDASLVLGMVSRGDRNHDIAAWFGVNQGRIDDVKKGLFDPIIEASSADLPPKGPPGLKGRRLRSTVAKALGLLELLKMNQNQDVRQLLMDAIKRYDANES